MSLLTIPIVVATVLSGTVLCFGLLTKTRDSDATVWILEHIICPIIRILVLLVIVSQIYPVIDDSSSGLGFWRILAQQGQFNDLINILFFGGLLLAFIPIVNHPVFALPIQSMLTIALIFHWQYQGMISVSALIPSLATILKITIYMLFAYFLTRESSIRLARWIDDKLVITGSVRLIADTIYLVLQIPVMLLYCSFLKSQLT